MCFAWQVLFSFFACPMTDTYHISLCIPLVYAKKWHITSLIRVFRKHNEKNKTPINNTARILTPLSSLREERIPKKVKSLLSRIKQTFLSALLANDDLS